MISEEVRNCNYGKYLTIKTLNTIVFLSRWHFGKGCFPVLKMNPTNSDSNMNLISYSKILLIVVSVNSHAAMVWYWSGHGSYSSDDTCCRVITKNSICGFSIFSSPTKDIDFPITDRHATVFLIIRSKRESVKLYYNNCFARNVLISFVNFFS